MTFVLIFKAKIANFASINMYLHRLVGKIYAKKKLLFVDKNKLLLYNVFICIYLYHIL